MCYCVVLFYSIQVSHICCVNARSKWYGVCFGNCVGAGVRAVAGCMFACVQVPCHFGFVPQHGMDEAIPPWLKIRPVASILMPGE